MQTNFLDRLADSSPTPAGGSAAAYTAAAAAALVSMVAKLTLHKKNYAHTHDQMATIIERAENFRQVLFDFVEIDATTYEEILLARRLPHDTPSNALLRQSAVERATFCAAEIPLQTARYAIQVMSDAVILEQIGNINTIADAACAVALANASITVAWNNVKINLLAYKSNQEAQRMSVEMDQILRQAEDYHRSSQVLMKNRGGI